MTEKELSESGLEPYLFAIPHEIHDAVNLLSNFFAQRNISYLGGVASRKSYDELIALAVSKQTFIDEAQKTNDYLRKQKENYEAGKLNQEVLQIKFDLERIVRLSDKMVSQFKCDAKYSGDCSACELETAIYRTKKKYGIN